MSKTAQANVVSGTYVTGNGEYAQYIVTKNPVTGMWDAYFCDRHTGALTHIINGSWRFRDDAVEYMETMNDDCLADADTED